MQTWEDQDSHYSDAAVSYRELEERVWEVVSLLLLLWRLLF